MNERTPNDQTPPTVITKSMTIRCHPMLAFRVWTTEIDLWWPKGHTLSGDPKTEVLIEGAVGGRFYERTADGVEHTWGEITAWEPPHFVAFTWHLGTSPQQPTSVAVRFYAQTAQSTRVEIVHRGPELIGRLWSTRSPHFDTGWEAVLHAYAVFTDTSHCI